MAYFVTFVEKFLADGTRDIVLPIRAINNIPVTCTLDIDTEDQTVELNIYYEYIGITPKNWQEKLFNLELIPDGFNMELPGEDREPFISKDGIINHAAEFVEQVKIVKSLKFDHYLGTFTLEKVEDPTPLEDMFACDNIELNFDKCVVCYRHTTVFTACNHPLCHECWGKIPALCKKCKTGRKCPICREARIEHCSVECENCYN